MIESWIFVIPIRVYYCISVKVESCVTTHSPVSIQLSVTHTTAVNKLVRVMLTWHTAVNESVRVMLTWHEIVKAYISQSLITIVIAFVITKIFNEKNLIIFLVSQYGIIEPSMVHTLPRIPLSSSSSS
jgi:hypothetical protein